MGALFSEQPLQLITDAGAPRALAVVGALILLKSEVSTLDQTLFQKPLPHWLVILFVARVECFRAIVEEEACTGGHGISAGDILDDEWCRIGVIDIVSPDVPNVGFGESKMRGDAATCTECIGMILDKVVGKQAAHRRAQSERILGAD